MVQQQNNNIPQEVRKLKLCASLQDCGGTAVELCIKESMSNEMSIYDDDDLQYSDWIEGNNNSPKSFLAYNNNNKNLVLLPLDNRIISGPATKKGGVADCAILTLNDMSFIEFKTNVTLNSEDNLSAHTEKAIQQLWHTYDGIIKPKCEKKGVIISDAIDNIDFYIVFNKELDVTGIMASRLNYQMEFMSEHSLPLFFENEKDF